MKASLIGVGYWGSFIYKTLKEIGFTDIELCDPQVPGACNNYKKMEDSHYIFIATPVKSHFELCKYFLSQGKRVFCEKPLVSSEEEAQQLYEIAEKNNTYLYKVFKDARLALWIITTGLLFFISSSYLYITQSYLLKLKMG